jgi:hypothetical protein
VWHVLVLSDDIGSCAAVGVLIGVLKLCLKVYTYDTRRENEQIVLDAGTSLLAVIPLHFMPFLIRECRSFYIEPGVASRV